MRILLGLLRILTGISLAIAILFFAGKYGIRYAMTRLTAPPARPVFSEEASSGGITPASSSEQATTEDASATELPGEVTGADSPPDDATTSPGVQDDNSAISDDAPLEPGAYRARVIQPIGLIMRQGPDVSTIQLGGIAYNEEVIVLAESSDQQWIQVRLTGSDIEGWVKNGNTEPIE